MVNLIPERMAMSTVHVAKYSESSVFRGPVSELSRPCRLHWLVRYCWGIWKPGCCEDWALWDAVQDIG